MSFDKQRNYVYWIHLPEHTDITSQGYVGITKLDVKHRFELHKKAKPRKGMRHTVIMYALAKYKDTVVIETLLEGSREYCLMIENKLRPDRGIGWNVAVGGSAPMLGVEVSDSTRKKLSAFQKGRKHTPELRKINSEAQKRYRASLNPWDDPHTNSPVWLLAEQLYTDFKTLEHFGRRSVSKRYDKPVDSVVKIVNKIKQGWIPSEDSDYCNWKAQKELE